MSAEKELIKVLDKLNGYYLGSTYLGNANLREALMSWHSSHQPTKKQLLEMVQEWMMGIVHGSDYTNVLADRLMKLFEGEGKPMSNKISREKVAQIIGEASMCWDEPPLGIFDSSRAKALADRLMTLFNGIKDEGKACCCKLHTIGITVQNNRCLECPTHGTPPPSPKIEPLPEDISEALKEGYTELKGWVKAEWGELGTRKHTTLLLLEKILDKYIGQGNY
jgi:hypothetical protein